MFLLGSYIPFVVITKFSVCHIRLVINHFLVINCSFRRHHFRNCAFTCIYINEYNKDFHSYLSLESLIYVKRTLL